VLTADTYWAALTIAVLAIGGVYFLLRSRVGLVLTAIRDDERAARSSGVRVGLARMGVFIVAAAGCGAAGGVLAIEQLGVVPGTSGGVFSVQWTAEMAFAVIIGGIGTIEGPIIGTIVYMVLQQTLHSYNAWYLIVLGIVAIVIAIFARRGLWGTLDERFNIRLFPVGYHLWADGERRGRRRPAAPAASSPS
jgi:branched-chain amino acid transport system permease protein